MSNSKHELISVIIPAYNHEKFIKTTISSVLNQTYEHLELIIVDDGSTDNTPEVINSFKDSRIRSVRQTNQDAYNALNRGLAMAQGSITTVLNSDDIYHLARLEVLTHELKEKNALCLFTNVRPVDAEGTPLPKDHPWHAWHERNRQFYFQCNDLYTAFLRGNLMVTTSNLFLRTEFAQKIGNFAPIRYLHDYDYILRALAAAPAQTLYLDKTVLLDYRIHGSNTLSRGAVTAREQDQELILKYMQVNMPEPYKSRAETAALRLLELERELQAERVRLACPARQSLAKIYKALTGKRH